MSADPPTGLAANSLPPLTFKPSRFKDSWPLAFLTTNCHWQQILVNPPRAGQLPSGEQETSEMPTSQMPTSEMPASEMPTSEMPTSEMSTSEIGRSGPVEPGRYEMVTCGCPAAHACKFRSGGLIKIESRIAKCVRSLESPSLPPIERKLLVQRREWLLFQRSERLSVCIGQALGGLATIVHARVRHALASSPADLQLWAECGFLVGWESLLSTSGKEKRMLGDTWGAIIALQTLRVRFALRHGAPVGKPTLQIDYQSTEEASVSVRYAQERVAQARGNILSGYRSNVLSARGTRVDTSNRQTDRQTESGIPDTLGEVWADESLSRASSDLDSSPLPDFGAEAPPLLLTIGLPAAEYEGLPASLQSTSMRMCICLFSQGVNETQTVANATGRTELQEEINRESLEWLAAYARSVADFVLPKPEPAPQLEDVRAPRASCKVRVSTAVASCATKRMSMGGKRASVTKMQPFAKSLKPERAPAALTDLREGSEAGEGSETGAADPTVEADEVALAQSGTLEVFVRSGRSLLAADANGLSDPYVVVTVAQGKTWRTKVVAKTLDPVWNESHKFRGTLAEFAEAPLVLRVMDRDWGAADDPLGELIIDTAPLIEEQHMVFSSRPLDKVPTGELTFEIRWAPSGQLSNDFDATLSRDSRPSSPSTRGIYLGSMAKETLEERRMWQLRLLMAELRTIILSVSDGGGPRRKETRVLTLSALAVRILSGGRIISCKSGKDRTGMSVTAEQVSLLQQWHQCSAAGAQRLLDEMRRDGCRMENTRKNVGKRGYAFNGLQRALLPKGLRAAKDTTIAGLQS